jgi:hypothetical protein
LIGSPIGLICVYVSLVYMIGDIQGQEIYLVAHASVVVRSRSERMTWCMGVRTGMKDTTDYGSVGDIA